jgi:putative copper export protein
VSVVPLRAQSAAQIRAFEEVFEPLGLTALAIQVLTGLWMGWIYLPGFQGLFSPANPIGMLVGVKLLLLASTAALAVHARLRLIPSLTDDSLSGLAWHIRGITSCPQQSPEHWPRAFVYSAVVLSQGSGPRSSGTAGRG